jgi:hypothetical protein
MLIWGQQLTWCEVRLLSLRDVALLRLLEPAAIGWQRIVSDSLVLPVRHLLGSCMTAHTTILLLQTDQSWGGALI